MIEVAPPSKPFDVKGQKLLDAIDPEAFPLDARARDDVAALVRELHEQPSFGMLPMKLGKPTEPALPQYAKLAGKGLVEGATLGLVALPEIPDEPPAGYMFRVFGGIIGATLPYAAALRGARAIRWGARGLKGKEALAFRGQRMGRLGRVGMGVAGAATELAFTKTRDNDASIPATLLWTGISALGFAWAGPARLAAAERRILVREPVGVAARFRKPQLTWKRLNPADFPEEDQEMIRGFNALHKHITPGEIDFDDFQRVARAARGRVRRDAQGNPMRDSRGKIIVDRDEVIPDNYMVTPAETPKLKVIADGLTPAEAEAALDYYAPTRGLGEFHLGRFGKVVPGPKPPTKGYFERYAARQARSRKAESGASGEGSVGPLREESAAKDEASEIAAARAAMEAKLKPTMAEEQAATRQGKPRTIEEQDELTALVTRKRASASATGQEGKTIVTARGDVMTEAEALRKRGPVRKAHPFEDIFGLRTQIEEQQGAWRKTYFDTKGNRIATVRYIRRGTGPADWFPADAKSSDAMIVEFDVAKGWTEAIMLDMRVEGARFVRAPRGSTTRGLAHRLGARSISEELVGFSNIRRKKR